MNAAPPYACLDPAAVLAALDEVDLSGDGRILQLNSYENRVYQVHLEEGSAIVAKFYRPARWSDAQILEEHRFARQLDEADVPVVAPARLHRRPDRATADDALRLMGDPPTLAQVQVQSSAHRLSVSERRAGRAPNLEDERVLRWLGRFVARLHAVGERETFAHRRRLDVATYGRASRERIADSPWIGPADRAPWLAACDAALALADEAFARHADATGMPVLRLHGDLHPGNILWREVDDDDDRPAPSAMGAASGPQIVDLDDTCTGPAIQDLWMLLSGDAATMRRQLDALLEGYRLFRDFDPREAALIEALRTLRMIHHSAWIAERWSDPAFPAAFPWFATPGYWAQQTTQLREQIEAMGDRDRAG